MFRQSFFSEFFGTPSNVGCHHFIITQDSLKVFHSEGNSGWTFAGEVNWIPSHSLEAGNWIPFKYSLEPGYTIYASPWVQNISKSGTYISVNGLIKRSMHFRRTSEKNLNRLTGYMN